MGVFTQVASNIKAFARKSAYASCVNGALPQVMANNCQFWGIVVDKYMFVVQSL